MLSIFAYQSEPGETQWAGTIHQIDLMDVTSVEFGTDSNEKKCLHIYTKHGMITIKRTDAIADFRSAYNQYLYMCNAVQNFLPENANEQPTKTD